MRSGKPLFWTAILLLMGGGATLSAQTTARHYIFFAHERERITDTAFINHPNLAGAQLKYTWRELEPTRDNYDFSNLRADLATLEKHGKKLWIQLQDVSFSEKQVVPEYLLADTAFHGGVAREYEDGRFAGLAARRWDPAVRERFAGLLRALGREFDGRIEGINLAETAVGFHDPQQFPAGFTHESYAHGVREIMTAAKAAFPKSHVVVYANFMPGGERYLATVYAHAERAGVGVGGPDILPHRPFQQMNSLPLIAARGEKVIAAMAVQDGNLADRNRKTGERISVPELAAYATQKLRLNYIFWGTEEPYYSSAFLPLLR
jgi:hypothetical protein